MLTHIITKILEVGFAGLLVSIFAFLWMRRSHMWHFYFTLLRRYIAVQQDQTRRGVWLTEPWDQVAEDLDEMIVGTEIIPYLRKIEVEYLRNYLYQERHRFVLILDAWREDTIQVGRENLPVQVTESERVRDRTAYLILKVREMYEKKIKWCGLGIFISSLNYKIPKYEGMIEHNRNEGSVTLPRRPI
jgi:hypothetical protein